MRTKKGDWVRICHDGPNGMQDGPWLSRNRYKAVGAFNDGALVVEGPFTHDTESRAGSGARR